jgi:hypothetical protein
MAPRASAGQAMVMGTCNWLQDLATRTQGIGAGSEPSGSWALHPEELQPSSFGRSLSHNACLRSGQAMEGTCPETVQRQSSRPHHVTARTGPGNVVR